MRYYKQLSDNYILAIGTGAGNAEITEAEYNEIMSIIHSRPQTEGKGYRLKTDLTWEEYDLPSEPEPSGDDEITEEEAVSIIMGGMYNGYTN